MGIRKRIQQVLDEKGLTPRGVSLKAGLSDSMLHKFLTAQTKSMNVDTLERLAAALDVNPRWLIWGDAPAQPDPRVAYLFDRISQNRREQALRVLETFVEGDGESQAG